MTDDRNQLLSVILRQLSPGDISLKENRLLITERIEKLLHQNSWSKQQFTALMRKEIVALRHWLGHTTDNLTDICRLLNVSMGDLVTE